MIRWWGHACFEIRDNTGVVVDPHDGKSVGLPRPKPSGEVVLTTHNHFDHNAVEVVEGRREVLAGTGKAGGIQFEGVQAYHDKTGGRNRGRNTLFVFEMEGIRFSHLGDLGHALTGDQVRELGRVDVLFLPIGGVFTIDAKEADQVAEALEPRIIIPMHYKTPGLNIAIEGVEPFLDLARSRGLNIRHEGDTIELESLPDEPEVIVMTPPGG